MTALDVVGLSVGVLAVFWILPHAVRQAARYYFQERENHIRRVVRLTEDQGDESNGK